MNLGIIIVLIVILLGVAITLVIVGLRQERGVDPLEERLADFAAAGEITNLEDIELSQSFVERIILPLAANMGEVALKFTPQRALEQTQRKLEMAGNPRGIDPTVFFAGRFIVAAAIAVLLFVVFSIAPNQSPFTVRNILMIIGFTALGFFVPNLLLDSKVKRRQKDVTKALPDALDLLTICVEAGLGLEAAMKKVNEKWDNELALAFGRALQEIQLGKVRREALRDMADRIGATELNSFVAAVIQSEQLGVSMAKILRIQSDDMRIKRRQRAEQEAQTAPIKMLFPMALLIFPTIMMVLMGPAALSMMRSSLFK
ncbi:MAG: type II secretion system F family protein [Anaerolineae bacterium]|nr:MAG: type II secretion system F family protein [Anaerolineae bacterium]